jgi:hypothetical protein
MIDAKKTKFDQIKKKQIKWQNSNEDLNNDKYLKKESSQIIFYQEEIQFNENKKNLQYILNLYQNNKNNDTNLI